MKTDNSSLFEYSILQFQDCDGGVSEFSVDYRREPHEEDVITEYEQRFSRLVSRSIVLSGLRMEE